MRRGAAATHLLIEEVAVDVCWGATAGRRAGAGGGGDNRITPGKSCFRLCGPRWLVPVAGCGAAAFFEVLGFPSIPQPER